MRDSRILLVESGDSLLNTFLLSTIPYTEVVGSVTSGMKAMSQYERIRPDIIFIDTILADMTGLEVARWIREQNQDIKIILVSHQLRLEFLLAGIESGIDGYMQKDADSETLQNAIDSVMQGNFFTQRPAATARKAS